MSDNFDIIVIFPILGQFWAIRKSNSTGIVCKTYLSINSHLLCYKNYIQNKKRSYTALLLLLSVKLPFLPKNADFLQKRRWHRKIKETLVLEGIFSESAYVHELI